MRQSQLFTKTRRDAPKDEIAKNAVLLTRAGFLYKEMAGVYDYLPLGFRVLKRIETIIREEMNATGAEEVFLSTLQPSGTWERTGRWSDEVVDNWFKTALKDGSVLGLAHTHEEPLTTIAAHYVQSWRDLPRSIYQFQTKFRNELRAKSGIMRGREFIMKDLYSFSRDQDEHDACYERMKHAYRNVFDRVGIGKKTHFTYASGGSFSAASHEFQTETEAGEDVIYVDPDAGRAINKEMLSDDALEHAGMRRDRLVEKRAVEVGNIFPLGTRFSNALGLTYRDASGAEHPVIMGSYGIGLGRLMGTVAEVLSDAKGLVWPAAIAPFDVHVIALARGEGAGVHTAAEKLVTVLEAAGFDVLYDDREEKRAGEKFADADLIGIPWRAVVSEKTIAAGGVEVKKRTEEQSIVIAESALLAKLNMQNEKGKTTM